MENHYRLNIFLFFVLFSSFLFAESKYIKPEDLSEEKLVSQIVMLYAPLLDRGKISRFIQENTPAAIFLNKSNLPKKGRADARTTKELLDKIRNFYRIQGLLPPLFAIDQEMGYVTRITKNVTHFPSAYAVGTAFRKLKEENSQKAKQMVWGMAFHVCRDLLRFGVDWNLTPVADVNSNPNNPVIGVRSFGDNPRLVAEVALLYSQGLRDAGCLDSIKHFPGHGDTKKDSHKALPYVKASWETLNNRELFPFKHIIEDNPASVMLAHIVFPEQDKWPASFSFFWQTKILKEKFGFQGIIISDDLMMQGARALFPNPSDMATRAIAAGTDMLLIAMGAKDLYPPIKKTLIRKIKQDAKWKKQILESARKINQIKLKYFTRQKEPYFRYSLLPADKINQELSRKAITKLIGNYYMPKSKYIYCDNPTKAIH
ncbi:MAG: glycoside hydrolase family 3 protein, partial [Candidatus Hydrogenedentota bacterium]